MRLTGPEQQPKSGALPFIFRAIAVALLAAQCIRPSAEPEPIDVGMVALLGSPHRYSGKRIRTTGFLVINFEGTAVYLHEEDYRYAMYGNAYDLDLPGPQQERYRTLNLKHVLIEGTTFAADGSVWGGRMTRITRLELWPSSGPR